MGSFMYIAPHWFGGNDHWYANGFVSKPPGSTSGVMGIARADCYYNGILEGAGTDTTTFRKFTIFAIDNGSGGVQSFATGSVQAYAVYNTVLSSTQMAAISAAMAAL
jgi:hypothetical protein